MTAKKFDLMVLGSGPGGYPAAIRAAQLGKKVALIEAKELGGTCLNRGCIPSKALIAGAEIVERMKEAVHFGITVGSPTVDYAKMVERKDQVVAKVRKGLEGLILANKIAIVRGFGKFTSPKTIQVTGQDEGVYEADQIIIATGSESRNIPAFPVDHKKILDSTSILEMKTLPKKLVIIGGGVIGCEFASLYQILGVEVTICEMMPTILPMEAKIVSSTLTKIFQRRGIKLETGVQVQGIDTKGTGVKVKLTGKEVDADIALVAVGRTMNTKDIGLDKAGVKVEANGSIPVNDKMETNVKGIYAIGDLASKWWLAHVATHQGLVAAINAAGSAAGKVARMHYNAVPSVIFTHPEIATCGLSLEEALSQKYDAAVGAFPFQALGKSQATGQTEGFAQIVIDKKTNQILGAQVIGEGASSLVAQMATAINNELTVECITDTIHAHPTLPEAWMEASFIAEGDPVHLPPVKK